MHKIGGGGGAFTGTSQQNMFAFYCEWFQRQAACQEILKAPFMTMEVKHWLSCL